MNQPVTTIVSVEVTESGLHVLDFDRSTYMGLSRDGSYWHQIAPATPDLWVVRQGKRRAGDLTCNCPGGRTNGSCYRVVEAEAYERAMADEGRWRDLFAWVPTAEAVSA